MYDRMRGEPIPLLIDKHKSIGHSHVLPPQYRTLPGALAVLHRLTQKAAMRLRSIDHYASELAIRLDYFDGQAWSEDLRLTETQDTLTLTNALNQLWGARPAGLRRKAPFRVGVVLTGLRPPWCHTPDLFTDGRDIARRRLLGAVDTLNHTFGNGSVYFGGAHGATDSAPMRISFTCIPTPELEEIDDARAGRVRPTPLAIPPPDEAVQADSSGD